MKRILTLTKIEEPVMETEVDEIFAVIENNDFDQFESIFSSRPAVKFSMNDVGFFKSLRLPFIKLITPIILEWGNAAHILFPTRSRKDGSNVVGRWWR